MTFFSQQGISFCLAQILCLSVTYVLHVYLLIVLYFYRYNKSVSGTDGFIILDIAWWTNYCFFMRGFLGLYTIGWCQIHVALRVYFNDHIFYNWISLFDHRCHAPEQTHTPQKNKVNLKFRYWSQYRYNWRERLATQYWKYFMIMIS